MDARTRGRGAAAVNSQAGFERYAVTLIVISGNVPGDEHGVLRPRWVIGSGPRADAIFDDAEMATEHAAVEFHHGSFRVQALADAGVELNGRAVEQHELRHGDRVKLGRHVIQVLIEKPDAAPIYRIDGS